MCKFQPLTDKECPDDPDIKGCSNYMDENELCEADQKLPGRNETYEIDNCNGYDVFKCTRGINSLLDLNQCSKD